MIGGTASRRVSRIEHSLMPEANGFFNLSNSARRLGDSNIGKSFAEFVLFRRLDAL
jgi:hypothetical protein